MINFSSVMVGSCSPLLLSSLLGTCLIVMMNPLPSGKPRIGPRLAAIQEESEANKRRRLADDPTGEMLAHFLLGLPADGILSSKHVQQGAQAALAHVNASEDADSMLNAMSNLGNQDGRQYVQRLYEEHRKQNQHA